MQFKETPDKGTTIGGSLIEDKPKVLQERVNPGNSKACDDIEAFKKWMVTNCSKKEKVREKPPHNRKKV